MADSPSGKRSAGPTGPVPDPQLAFEDALAHVESIIERIESGEVGLEESLAEYERGVHLINLCRAKLDQAQQKVQDLTKRLEQADEEAPTDEGDDSAR